MHSKALATSRPQDCGGSLSWRRVTDSELIEEKREDIRVLLDRLVERGADAVARARRGPQEHGTAARVGRLQSRRHLARLHWIHTVIVVPGEEQDRWVVSALECASFSSKCS